VLSEEFMYCQKISCTVRRFHVLSEDFMYCQKSSCTVRTVKVHVLSQVHALSQFHAPISAHALSPFHMLSNAHTSLKLDEEDRDSAKGSSELSRLGSRVRLSEGGEPPQRRDVGPGPDCWRI